MTHFTAETWIAIGTLTTAAVALAAGVAAFWQVREMRRTREHESRPYPVVFMELNDSNRHVVELVVKNFGRTCAYDVAIEFDPPLVRTAGSGRSEPVGTFDRLPVLVPTNPGGRFGTRRSTTSSLACQTISRLLFHSETRDAEAVRSISH